nr:hypothetical protein GCM10020092_078900 [Actinoplanes digitatis]
MPRIVDCQASAAGVPSMAETIRLVASTPDTVLSSPLAIFSAAASVSFGVVAISPMGLLCATEVATVLPAESVETTKSPPCTGRPL